MAESKHNDLLGSPTMFEAVSMWSLVYGGYPAGKLLSEWNKRYPGHECGLVNPEFLDGRQVFVFGGGKDYGVIPGGDEDGPATAMLWLCGSVEDQEPKDFLQEHYPDSKPMFNGKAEWRDGTLHLLGTSRWRFKDITEVLFIRVREQIDETDVLSDQSYPVVVSPFEATPALDSITVTEKDHPELSNALKKANRRVEERLEKMPQPVPREVRLGINHSEMNFWLNPQATFDGGCPVLLLYLSDDPDAMPSAIPVPADVDGKEVVPFMWGTLCKYSAKRVLYSATIKGDQLVAVVMSETEFYTMQCQILRPGSEWDLSEWVVQRYHPEE